MIRIAIAGALGRTGRRVLELACRAERFDVVAALTDAGDPACGTTERIAGESIRITSALDRVCEVLVDFSVPAGTMQWLAWCQAHGIPLITGVTGHSDEQVAALREAARTIAVLKASNFSLGVNVLLPLAARAAGLLGADFDIEIVEAHHRHKVDAPSGTALAFLDALASGTGRSAADAALFGRHGDVGARPSGQIGVHAVRMGEIVGRHEIHFSGPGETITLTHAAQSRDAFAAGALRAAEWIVRRPAGLYSMGDVVAEPAA